MDLPPSGVSMNVIKLNYLNSSLEKKSCWIGSCYAFDTLFFLRVYKLNNEKAVGSS